MKKIVYIVAFTILGILLQFLVHSFFEQNYIYFLLKDFDTYSFGFSWAQLYMAHKIISALFFIGGALFGFYQGKYWWKYIYVDKKIEYKFKNKKGLFWKILKY